MSSRHGKGEKIATNWNPWHHAWESNLKGKPLHALRDQLRDHLRIMGHPAESVESDSIDCGDCLLGGVAEIGLIEVGYGPIGWVYAVLDGNELLWGEIEYGVQDERQLPHVEVHPHGVRAFPIFGPVIDVRWKPTYRDPVALGIAASLTANNEIRDAILSTSSLADDILVSPCAQHSRWWINTLWKNPERPVSAEKWACYEAIARHLLAFPLDVK